MVSVERLMKTKHGAATGPPDRMVPSEYEYPTWTPHLAALYRCLFYGSTVQVAAGLS